MTLIVTWLKTGTMLPMLRAINASPGRRLKILVGLTRESEQANIRYCTNSILMIKNILCLIQKDIRTSLHVHMVYDKTKHYFGVNMIELRNFFTKILAEES